MGDKLKSAYELAMERLRKRDADRGEAAPRVLTSAQRKEIAAVREEYEAKLAEREILYRSQMDGAAGDPETQERIADEYRRDREFLESRREARLTEVRSGKD